jgi:hypothetical protein
LEDHTTPVQRQADSVAELDQAYKAAVEKPDWPTAAEKLNAFNYEDIQSRLALLGPKQVASLHNAALSDAGLGPYSQVAQLTAPERAPASTMPPQVTPLTELDKAYISAVKKPDWPAAAETLNAFNTEDIQKRIVQLNASQLASLHQGALDNPRVGPQSQIAKLTEPARPAASAAGPSQTAAGVSIGDFKFPWKEVGQVRCVDTFAVFYNPNPFLGGAVTCAVEVCVPLETGYGVISEAAANAIVRQEGTIAAELITEELNETGWPMPDICQRYKDLFRFGLNQKGSLPGSTVSSVGTTLK